MPFIKISTLATEIDKEAIMQKVEQALYDPQADGGQPLVPAGMVTCMWQTLDGLVHEGKGYQAYEAYPAGQADVPIFVDLYVNTFLEGSAPKIMEVVASILSDGTEFGRKWIFIHTHVGGPQKVFINGAVWDGAMPGT